MWLRSPIPVTIRPPVVTHQISEKRMNESQFIDALPAGTPISAYVIENELSSGGFGLVYLGHRHNKPDQKVAIKEFLPRDYARRDSTLSVKALSDLVLNETSGKCTIGRDNVSTIIEITLVLKHIRHKINSAIPSSLRTNFTTAVFKAFAR